MASTAQEQRAALERAVHISLFTWRRAGPDDPMDDADRRGWWGDSFPSVADDRVGSLLWLLRRKTLTAETMRNAQRYCEEALQWLVDDGYLTAVTVTIARPAPTKLTALIVLERPGGELIPLTFDDLLQVSYVV